MSVELKRVSDRQINSMAPVLKEFAADLKKANVDHRKNMGCDGRFCDFTVQAEDLLMRGWRLRKVRT